VDWDSILQLSIRKHCFNMEVVEEGILEDYLSKEDSLERNTEPRENTATKGKMRFGDIERAKPKIHGYRERYKSGTLKPSDVMVYSKPRRVTKQFDPGIIDPGVSSKAGYNPWFGEGTVVDF